MSPSASFLELVPSGRTNKYYVPTNSNHPLFQCSETTLRSFTPPPAEPVTPDPPLSRPINVSSTSCPEVSPMDTVSSDLPKCIASKNIKISLVILYSKEDIKEKVLFTENIQKQPYKHIDIDWSVRVMDRLFNATFYEYVRDEKNCECSALHIKPLLEEYTLKQTIQGLRWLINKWKPESISKFLKTVFTNWSPDEAGIVFARLSDDMQFQSQFCLITAFLLIRETADTSAAFIASISCNVDWNRFTKNEVSKNGGEKPLTDSDKRASKTTELISYLDSVLDWVKKTTGRYTYRTYK